MSELKSKAPLPSTFSAIEAEVFGLRSKNKGVPTTSEVMDLAAGVNLTDKIDRERAAIQLAATCIRIIEEVK